MKWNKDQSKQLTFYTAEANTASRIEAMEELWKLVESEIIPQNIDIEWDHIRIEIWPDSGRVIVFPASNKSKIRLEKAGCQVVFHELASIYNDLADSNIDDHTFTEKLASIEDEWVAQLINCAQQTNMRSIHLSFWESEGEQAFREFYLE